MSAQLPALINAMIDGNAANALALRDSKAASAQTMSTALDRTNRNRSIPASKHMPKFKPYSKPYFEPTGQEVLNNVEHWISYIRMWLLPANVNEKEKISTIIELCLGTAR